MSETIATSGDGRFRVILEHDQDADPGDGQGFGYVFYVDYSQRLDVVTVCDEYAAGTAEAVRDQLARALDRFPGDLDMVARYFRTIECALDTYDSRDGQYVGIVTPELERTWGCETGTGAPDLSEWRQSDDGDVWGYVIEERVQWTSNTIGGPREMTSWETVDYADGALWGLYGREYAEEIAREAWGHFLASVEVSA